MLRATGQGYEPPLIRLEGKSVLMGRFPAVKPEDMFDKEPRLVKIRLSDGSEPPSISRNHALFAFKDGHWLVQDHGSSNGIYINGDSVPISRPTVLTRGTLVKLSRSSKPSIEYCFEPDIQESNGVLSSELHKMLWSLVQCGKCHQAFRQAACLPCGHVFCTACVKSAICPICETELNRSGRGFAARCIPLDELAAILASENSPNGSDNVAISEKNVFFDLREAGEDGDEQQRLAEMIKRQKVELESTKMEGRCEYCAEPAHEDGEKCPSQCIAPSSEEEGSDVDDYV